MKTKAKQKIDSLRWSRRADGAWIAGGFVVSQDEPFHPRKWRVCRDGALVDVVDTVTAAKYASGAHAAKHPGDWLADVRGSRKAVLAKVAATKPGMRTFSVPLVVEVSISEALLAEVMTDDWRARMCKFYKPEKFAAHLAFNLVRGTPLLYIDGYADQPASRVALGTIECDADNVDEVA